MSMEPQVRQATGQSSFSVLEVSNGRARVQGPYGESKMEVSFKHLDCEFDGIQLVSYDPWATNVYCSGCNYSVYYPLGD